MISKIRIVDGGDTIFLPGSLGSFREFTEGNKEIIIKGKKPATGRPILLGITKHHLKLILSYQLHHSKRQLEF